MFQEVNTCLLPGLKILHGALKEKADAFADIIKIGRTHTQVSWSTDLTALELLGILIKGMLFVI